MNRAASRNERKPELGSAPILNLRVSAGESWIWDAGQVPHMQIS